MQYRILTITTALGGYEYVAQIGKAIYDRVGRQVGFKADKTSPQGFYNEVQDWISANY